MTMTREDAGKILADRRRRANNVIRAKTSRGMNTTADRAEAEALTIAIAALSAQEPWGWEWVDGSDTGVVTLRQDYEKYRRDYPRMTFTALYAAPPAQADTKQAEPCPWVRQSSEGTAYCELAESGAKQAEPLRVTREQLSEAWRAGLAATDKGCADWADEMLAALHQLGAKVEVSDG